MIETINNYTFKSFKNYSSPNQEEKFKQKIFFWDTMIKLKSLYLNEF